MTAVFVVHGLLFASWTAHIPDVKAHLGLTDGTLGFALLGAPVGSVTAMVAAAYLLPRLGSRRIVQVALVGYCAAGPFVGLTGTLPALFGALFVWGAFQGTLDVAMNTQAIAVERAGRRVLMSGLHGSWSIGSFAGAGIGALAVGAGVTLTTQLLVLGTLALLAAGLLTAQMLPDAADHAACGSRLPSRRRARGRRRGGPGGMVLLGAIAFASMLCEGATADWASVYLSGPLRASGVVPGLGYAAFSLAMVAVRLSGNRLLTRYRPDRLLPALAAVATIGFAAGLLIGRPVAALAGFLCLGIGLASVVPAVFSAAGRSPASPGHRRGHGIGLRLGRVRLRATAHRPARVAHLATRRSGPAAAAHRVHRRRHVARPRSEGPTATQRPTGQRGRDAMIEWLLVDYGEVLGTPPPDDTTTELAALAGQNPAEFLHRYW